MHLLQQITFQISIEHSRIHRDIAKNVVGNSNVVVSKNLNSLTKTDGMFPLFGFLYRSYGGSFQHLVHRSRTNEKNTLHSEFLWHRLITESHRCQNYVAVLTVSRDLAWQSPGLPAAESPCSCISGRGTSVQPNGQTHSDSEHVRALIYVTIWIAKLYQCSYLQLQVRLLFPCQACLGFPSKWHSLESQHSFYFKADNTIADLLLHKPFNTLIMAEDYSIACS